MAKETKNVTIPIEDYNYLRNVLIVYKSILGVLATSIKSEGDTQYKYSTNKVGNGYYCEEMDEVVRQIFTFIRYFDTRAYAVITGQAIEITSETLHKLVEELSAEAEEEGEDEEPEVEA